MTKEEKTKKLTNELRWHQAQLHYLLGLYYSDKYTAEEKEYNQECTNSTYRHHLIKTAEIQDSLNKNGTATF